MLKKLLLIALIVAPVSIFAQDKIAFINTQEIFTKIPEMSTIQAKLEAESKKVEANAKLIETEYQSLLKKFSEDATEPSVSVIADRQKQLEQLKDRYESYVQTSQMELEQSQQKEMAPLRQKMLDAIKQVGDENNYLYIADSSVFMYTSPTAIDASKQVKAKLGIKD